MSPAGKGASLAPEPLSFAAPAHVRLKVEQASYAYSATDQFRAEIHVGTGEFRSAATRAGGIRPECQRKIHAAEIARGTAEAAFRPRGSGRQGSERVGARARAQQVALVSQESELLFSLRVWEYVLQGRYPYGKRLRFESDEDSLMAGNALAQVGADLLRDRWMDQLSGGEKQRVILARALAQRPGLLAARRTHAASGHRRQSGIAAAFAAIGG